MGKVLADAGALLQHIGGRGAGAGGTAAVDEILVDALHQLDGGIVQRTARRKRGPGVIGSQGIGRRIHRREHEDVCRVVAAATVVGKTLAHLLPGHLAGHHPGLARFHHTARLHRQHIVRCRQREPGRGVAENVLARLDHARIGINQQLVLQALLGRGIGRAQKHLVLRIVHHAAIAVARFVQDMQLHAGMPSCSRRMVWCVTTLVWVK